MIKRFSWLIFKNNKMYCKICKQYNAVGNFAIDGCSNFKKESLEIHNNSNSHKKALENSN